MKLPRVNVVIEAPPTCIKCHKPISLLASITYNKRTGRCGKCERHTLDALASFRRAFVRVCADGVIAPNMLTLLQNGIQNEQVSWSEAMAEVRSDALQFLERTLAFAASDGIITDEETASLRQWQQVLEIPATVAAPVLERLAYMQQITRIRQGTIPLQSTAIHLAIDERCHLDVDATYRKVLARSIVPVPGRLVATNKQLLFTSPTEGWSIKLKNITQVVYEADTITLNLSIKKGAGRYTVPDAYLTEAVITALIKLDNRLLLTPQGDGASRHIPQDIKKDVWNRDQGKCVQCSATSYLEFDHIIPWSKGGASTLNNVQLLCRKCNLTKSDSI